MEEIDYLIEEALRPTFEDELRMSLLDDIVSEESLFKLKAIKTHIAESPLRGDQGINAAINRRIETVSNNG